MAAVDASDARESMVQVAALQELIDYVADDRAPKSELRLITRGIGPLEFIETPRHQFVERRLPGTSRQVSPWKRRALPHEFAERTYRANT